MIADSGIAVNTESYIDKLEAKFFDEMFAESWVTFLKKILSL